MGLTGIHIRGVENGSRSFGSARRNGAAANGNGHHEDLWADLRAELERSRRFAHSFALIRVSPRSAVPRGRASGATRADFAALVRGVDRTWVADGAVYLLLPESDVAAARALVGRLERDAPELVLEADVRVAGFPDDALTGGGLLSALAGERADVARNRVSAPVAGEHVLGYPSAAVHEPSS